MLIAGVDIGGTFTDVVLLDSDEGSVSTAKVLSTPDDFVRGVRQGLVEALGRVGRPTTDVASILHGTTVITNAMIERRGAKTALVTNHGFRDIVEMGTEIRYDVFDLQLRAPEPLVPRELRLGVRGRMRADGTEFAPVDADDVAAAARLLREHGVQTVAVSMLHAYANGAHESQIRQLLTAELGAGVPITLSHEIAPEPGEFERTTTACANAYVMPLAADYLGRLADELAGIGVTAEPHIMASNGGFIDVAGATARPVALIESGPAGGAIAAAYLADLVGVDDVLSFDMGGTTAKLCFLQQRKPRMAYTFEAARLERFRPGSGLPLSIPVIEMIEIGTGGGSIAHVDQMGLLAVGPRSAGAQPGPAAYGLGGTEPTVTDADILAGLIGADTRLGGHLALRADLAARAIADLAAAGGFNESRLVDGIIVQVVESMAQAARLHAAESNIDLRAFAMVAFGGAGPVHAYFLAKRLGVRWVHFPAGAGVLSAYGFTVAESRVDLTDSHPALLESVDWDGQRSRLEQMRGEGESRLERLSSGLSRHDVQVDVVADMRLSGQGFVLHVPVPWNAALGGDLAELRRCFQASYRSSYGVEAPHGQIELVSWRFTVRSLAKARGEEHVWSDTCEIATWPMRTRRVDLPSFGLVGELPVLARADVPLDGEMTGPALVEDRNTAIVVGADATVTRRASGDLIMVIGQR